LSSILLPLESAAGASLIESGLKTFLHHRLPSKPFTYGLERDVCMYTTVPDGPGQSGLVQIACTEGAQGSRRIAVEITLRVTDEPRSL
jgi:hypothetical protein